MIPRTARAPDRARKGVAAVELALCMPLIMILVMGTLETTDLIFLRQRLETAAYEAARTATAPGQTSAAGVTTGTAVLTSRGVHGGSVTISPMVTSTTATGTEVAVTVTAAFASNSYMKPFLLGRTVTDVTVTVRMMRQ